jgi:hypothetical protein
MKPFQTFVKLYALYNQIPYEVFDKKFDEKAYISWNSYMSALRVKCKLQHEDIRLMIYFAYLHNPLDCPLTEYGDCKVYYRVASRYKHWKSSYWKEIKTKGAIQMIFETKPTKQTEIDMEILKDLD